ncbi:hypothetical protein BDM02DRAFT_3121472 [Thelephora ganbajun]|uniref:Uncharacterized protein n=1 Tax=Thelephora ganbajun TaxID=370292 RepID=A0ACB6Z549_THEGA|nr:hypothetical protein BDM02DRAFT_3121472 [Thelephora ganbajun]
MQAMRNTELFGGQNSSTFRVFEEFCWKPLVKASQGRQGRSWSGTSSHTGRVSTLLRA